MLLSVIPDVLEKEGISADANNTIIFIGFIKAMNDYDFVRRITKWKANIFVEYCCSELDLARGELKYMMESPDWNIEKMFFTVEDKE